MKELNELRKKVDNLDKRIVGYLNQRAKLALQIGELKTKAKRGVFAPDREKEVYNKVTTANKGPLSNNAIKSIYREIMSGALTLLKPGELHGFVKKGLRVLLVLGPCGICHTPKTKILEALLHLKDKVFTHLVVDSMTAKGLFVNAA